MSRVIPPAVALLLLVPAASAVPLVPFSDTDDFARRATEVVVADCLDPDPDPGPRFGVSTVAVDVVRVLKGDRKTGRAKLATTGQPMEKGRRYLMTSFGGSALGTTFVANAQLAVVEVPPGFDLKALDGKTVPEQMQLVFDARREQVRVQLIRLGQEKTALEKAVRQPAALAPPEVRFAGVTRRDGDNVLAFDVVNPNAAPVPYTGYTPDSFSPRLAEGRIYPLHRVEFRKGGGWKEEKLGWCGTGVGPVSVAKGQKARFDVPVPEAGDWDAVRIGVSWSPGARAHEVAWSRPITAAELRKGD